MPFDVVVFTKGGFLTLGRTCKFIPVIQEGWMDPPELLICCSISKRFYLQWKALDLVNKMRYIILVVALLGTCDVSNNNRHLGFYQESSGAEVLSSKRKLRKTLRGVASPPPPNPCPSEGKMIKMPFQLSNWHFSK